MDNGTQNDVRLNGAVLTAASSLEYFLYLLIFKFWFVSKIEDNIFFFYIMLITLKNLQQQTFQVDIDPTQTVSQLRIFRNTFIFAQELLTLLYYLGTSKPNIRFVLICSDYRNIWEFIIIYFNFIVNSNPFND